MTLLLLCFVVGTTLLQLLPVQPDPSWLALLLLVPVCGLYSRLRPVAALLLGLFWSFVHVSIQLSALLPVNLEGKDLTLTGVVSTIPVIKGSMIRFEMDLLDLKSPQPVLQLPQKVRLSWYQGNQSLSPGQIWRLKVRLKRPRGMQNPGGFDFERWLFARGIQATGYVRSWDGNQLQGLAYWSGWIDRMRQQLAATISDRVTDTRSAALIKALAIGDRSGMSSVDWRMFSNTGTSHLVAISGLHIGMVAGLVFLLGHWVWRRSEWLLMKMAAIRAAAWMALGSATAYAALAGFSLPTQRAVIMLTLGLGAILSGRSLSVSRSLTLALFGVVLVDPYATLSAGFWLSFGAVAVILLAMAGRIRSPKGWRNWGRVQWVVALGLAPLLFILFNKASLISPLVNLILVPWFSFVLVPLVLLTLVTMHLALLSDLLFDLLGVLTRLTLLALDWFSQLPFALLYRPDLPEWSWLIAIAGVVLLLLPRGIPGRVLGLILISPMLFKQAPKQNEGSLLFTLLDVGQGLSCVVETADHVLVYDTGPVFTSGFNTAQAVLIPYLRSRGIEQVDQLILSNGDKDHAGGVEHLLREVEVKRLMSSEPLSFMDVDMCRMGMAWQWGGVDFRILHPGNSDHFASSNDASCVLMITNDAGSILLTGDVERDAERVLVQRHGAGLKADILVAPHHGSKTSSTKAFVEHADPAYVLFPTGYRNRFGFPQKSVVERWRHSGAIPLNTAETGAIQFQLETGQPVYDPVLYRDHHSHFWSYSQILE